MINVNSSEWLIFVAVLLSAFATFITRVTPFYIIKSKSESKFANLIEKHMGLMIMVILVCYCFKDINFKAYPYGASEILASMLAILVHIKFKNMLLSILISTFFYMFLIRIF
ncbi:MAG: AzlD domain-containing protein [Campylobacter sp.]|nr:AzlD domain-containing protein [Campylobacter sp.]